MGRRLDLRGAQSVAALAVAVAALTAMAGAGLAAAAGADQAGLGATRQATAAFHSLAAAESAGYGPFYVCTDEDGLGAMGQHYVNGGLVGDPAIDPLRPEALVYEPGPSGGLRLVGVEWVVFQAAWDAANPAPPALFGRTFGSVGEPNRYGLPPFYALHAWIWRPNPAGTFADWNPRVSCRGNGD